MGKQKHLSKILDLFEKSPVVSHSTIQKQVHDKGYAKQIVHSLIRKGSIKRLAKGYYTMHDNPQLIAFCLKPAYFGLQDALSLHNLWEQETIPVLVTSRKVRAGMRKVMGVNVLVRRIEKKYMFGFEHMQDGESYLPYSDVEKTLIDMVHFRERPTEEAITNIRININRRKLDQYLQHYGTQTRKSVLSLLKNKRK